MKSPWFGGKIPDLAYLSAIEPRRGLGGDIVAFRLFFAGYDPVDLRDPAEILELADLVRICADRRDPSPRGELRLPGNGRDLSSGDEGPSDDLDD